MTYVRERLGRGAFGPPAPAEPAEAVKTCLGTNPASFPVLFPGINRGPRFSLFSSRFHGIGSMNKASLIGGANVILLPLLRSSARVSIASVCPSPIL